MAAEVALLAYDGFDYARADFVLLGNSGGFRQVAAELPSCLCEPYQR